MKLGMLWLALILGSAAQAEPGNSDPSRELQNLVYYPHAGEVLGSGLIGATINDNAQTNNARGGVDANNISSNYFTVAGTYGFTDKWRTTVSEQYLIYRHNSITSDTSGAQYSPSSTGFSDPTLTGYYRWANGEVKPFFADLELAVKPSLGPERVAAQNNTVSQNGNNFSGDWTTAVALPMYWRCGMHELMISPSVTYNFGGQLESITATGSNTRSPYWQESVSIAERIHFSNAFYLQPGIALGFPYSVNDTNQAGGMGTSQIPWLPTWQLSAGYLPRSTVVLNLNLSYYSYNSVFVSSTALQTETEYSQLLATGQVRFLF